MKVLDLLQKLDSVDNLNLEVILQEPNPVSWPPGHRLSNVSEQEKYLILS